MLAAPTPRVARTWAISSGANATAACCEGGDDATSHLGCIRPCRRGQYDGPSCSNRRRDRRAGDQEKVGGSAGRSTGLRRTDQGPRRYVTGRGSPGAGGRNGETA